MITESQLETDIAKYAEEVEDGDVVLIRKKDLFGEYSIVGHSLSIGDNVFGIYCGSRNKGEPEAVFQLGLCLKHESFRRHILGYRILEKSNR